MSRDGDVLIIDAGLGIHALGNELVANKKNAPLRLSLLLTHFHFDHIMGLPFFAPLYAPQTEIAFYSAAEPEETQRNLGLLMKAPFFPVFFEQTPAKKLFKKIGAEGVVIGGIHVSFCPLRHPQGSVAFRLEENDKAVVFATDTEPPAKGVDEVLTALAKGAACLIYDAMFTPEEYASRKRDWGHSTWLEGTKTAEAAGVERLILSHLNPDYSDRDIRRIERLARKMFPPTDCAQEGMRLRFK